MKLKNNLKYLRRSKGFDLTQKQLADALGLTAVTIYKVENGLGVNIMTALKMAKFFGCSVEDIFEMEE
jgi:putative transcriptional regulator